MHQLIHQILTTVLLIVMIIQHYQQTIYCPSCLFMVFMCIVQSLYFGLNSNAIMDTQEKYSEWSLFLNSFSSALLINCSESAKHGVIDTTAPFFLSKLLSFF